MDLMASVETYLIIHGISTVGAIVVFLIRNEHRITRLETKLEKMNQCTKCPLRD